MSPRTNTNHRAQKRDILKMHAMINDIIRSSRRNNKQRNNSETRNNIHNIQKRSARMKGATKNTTQNEEECDQEELQAEHHDEGWDKERRGLTRKLGRITTRRRRGENDEEGGGENDEEDGGENDEEDEGEHKEVNRRGRRGIGGAMTGM